MTLALSDSMSNVNEYGEPRNQKDKEKDKHSTRSMHLRDQATKATLQRLDSLVKKSGEGPKYTSKTLVGTHA